MSGPKAVPSDRNVRRLWPRFTLRLLLAAITLVCMLLAVWTHRAREQRRVVERIEAGLSMVCYERDGPAAPVPRNFVVEWVARCLGRDYCEGVVSVAIQDRRLIGDCCLLRGLKSLRIQDPLLSDDDLAPVASCRNLERVQVGDAYFFKDELPKSLITDKSLRLLATLPKLEAAELHGTGFTLDGIEALAQSASLRELEIGLCVESIDVRQFERIKRLGRLQSFAAWRATRSGNGFEQAVEW